MPRFDVTPERPAVDTALRIRLLGATGGTRVVIRATSGEWSSRAEFVVPASGPLDLTEQAPTGGTYSGADPMGLVWSMSRDEPGERQAPLTLTAEQDGSPLAMTSVDRLRLPDGVTSTEIRTDGLVGTLCVPDDGRRYPGIVMLGGSEGGLHDDDAALLAGHGFAVLALAYFGMPGVPDRLARIPLEYFGTALRFLGRHPRVLGDRLGVLGGSFGGQAALLVGATFPEVRAVVSVAGSGVITQGIDGDIVSGDFLHIMATEVPPWMWRGTPLPFVANPVTPELRRQVDAGEPVAMRASFEHGMADTARLAAATIPVERIRGAVLLISVGDDRSWPCDSLSEIAMRRLAAQPHEHRHVHFPRAGHAVCAPPFRPTTETVEQGPGVLLDLGGTPEDNAAAQRDAWAESIAFLRSTLAPDTR